LGRENFKQRIAKEKENKLPTQTREAYVTLWPCCLHFLSILKEKKKNYENSNISSCKNIISQKNPLKENQNPSRYHNSIITHLKFQHKSKYHLSNLILI
jgi:hypothetical protein